MRWLCSMWLRRFVGRSVDGVALVVVVVDDGCRVADAVVSVCGGWSWFGFVVVRDSAHGQLKQRTAFRRPFFRVI